MVKNYIKVVLTVVILVPIYTGRAAAQQQSPLIINEVMTANKSSAAEEFVEIYNTSDSTVVLNGWQLLYIASGNNDWNKPTRKIPLAGTIAPKSYFLAASSSYKQIIPNMTFSPTLAQAGGHLGLAFEGTVYDRLGWGSAAAPAVAAAPSPPPGQSLVRLGSSTGNNNLDYGLSSQPSPGSVNMQPLPVTQSNAADTSVKITELLPNPAPPVSDADGEFVELFNSGSQPVALAGYKLTSGAAGNHSYILPAITAEPGRFITFYSEQSHMALSNTSGQVRLYDAAGVLVDQTMPYSKAADGQSWIPEGDSWQWTASMTPGGANILTAPAVLKAKKTIKAAKIPKSAPLKKHTAAVKKTSKAVPLDSVKPTNAALSGVPPTTPSHPYVLAGAAVLALLYACYEYRFDVANAISKHRKNRASRRAAGRPS